MVCQYFVLEAGKAFVKKKGKLTEKDFKAEKITSYIFESNREKELIFAFKTVYESEIIPSDELDGGRFWTIDDIKQNIGKGVFTPNFENEIKRINLITSL